MWLYNNIQNNYTKHSVKYQSLMIFFIYVISFFIRHFSKLTERYKVSSVTLKFLITHIPTEKYSTHFRTVMKGLDSRITIDKSISELYQLKLPRRVNHIQNQNKYLIKIKGIYDWTRSRFEQKQKPSSDFRYPKIFAQMVYRIKENPQTKSTSLTVIKTVTLKTPANYPHIFSFLLEHTKPLDALKTKLTVEY